MVQLIRNRTIGGILIGILVIVVSKFFFEFVPEPPHVTYTPLFFALKKIIVFNDFIEIAIAVSFVAIQAGLLTFLLHYHKVIKERTFFPFIIYVLVALVYSEQFYLNPASFLNFFMILIIHKMLNLQESGKNPGLLFLDIGTLIGISFLFAKETIYFIPAVLIGVLIVYTYEITNFLIMLLSTFIVLLISAGVYYLSGNISDFLNFFTFTPIKIYVIINHWQERFYILLSILFALVLISYLIFQFKSTSVTNKAKRFAGVFLVFWIVSILVVFVQEVNLWYNMALAAIPASVFASNYFQERKGNNWIKNILFLLLVLGLISVQLNY
ncbi:MAG: hypothetical protein HUU47_00635 [Bacteroidetes bacterium]|nr:hypothetical protein [Bacteroidota bacterium]